MKKKCFLVVGARPNFMKAAALYPELCKYFDVVIIHTGQHYDDNMSGIFFRDFDMEKISFKFNYSHN
jgi:UDP-N-acetylglucosamine 2-epimerase